MIIVAIMAFSVFAFVFGSREGVFFVKHGETLLGIIAFAIGFLSLLCIVYGITRGL